MNQVPARDRQCVDYLLGMMDQEQRSRFEAQLDADAALKTELDAWQERIGMLAGALQPMTPRDELRQAVLALVQSQSAAPAPEKPAASGTKSARRVPPRRAKIP